MSNYVYDNTSLPSGKVDAPGKNLGVPANQKLTAAEYAVLTQAIEDLRTAVLSGKYHGLANNPAAAVSGALATILRSRNGALEISENGSDFRGIQTVFNVKAFGAKGDGTTDDATAIQAAITAATIEGGIVYLPPGNFAVGTEIVVNDPRVTLRGSSMSGTSIVAKSAITSCCLLNSLRSTEHITFDAATLATYAARTTGNSIAIFDRVQFRRARRDGFYSAAAGINDGNVFNSCYWANNGTVHRSGVSATSMGAVETTTTGTVSTTAGSVVLTGSGTAFTQLGLRINDLIRVGPDAGTFEHLQIASVDSDTQITLTGLSPSALTRSGQPFATGTGDGYHEEPYGDNNISHFNGGLARGNAGCGLVFNGLYGPRVRGTQIDSHHLGYAVRAGSEVAVSFNPYFEGVYIEECAAGGFNFCYVSGVVVSGTTDTGLGPPASNGVVASGAIPPRWRTLNGYHASGVWLGSSGFVDATAGHAMDVIGGAWSNVPVSDSIGPGNTFTVHGKIAYGGDVSSPVAGTTINPNTAFAALTLFAGTMTSMPTIATAGHTVGDKVFLHGYQNAGPLVFQDDSLLSGSKLHLAGRQQMVLNTGDWADFSFGADGKWHLIGTSGTLQDIADSTASAGATTQHALSGRAAIAAGASSIVITNNKVTATSKVFAQLQTVDGTLTTIKAVVPGSGSFTINGNANATGNVNLAWQVVP